MLIVVAVMAIPLGWVAMRLKTGRDKGHAIADLKAMGVSIVMDRYQNASPMISPSVRELFGWQSVGIALNVNSDDAVSKLNGMHNLQTLWIGGVVTNSGMMHLKSLNSLEELTNALVRIPDPPKT